MGKTPSVIDINGRRYDAASGAMIDGVRRLVKKSPDTKKAAVTARPKAPIPKASIKAKPARAASSSARAVHRRQQKSQTLLRGVVYKPSIKIKSAGTSLARAGSKSSGKMVDSARQSRARLVNKHPLIERFGAPAARRSEAVIGEVMSPSAKKVPAAKTGSSTAPIVATAASHQRLERLLDAALVGADAHKQAIKHSRRSLFGLPRRTSWTLIGLIIITVVILAVWLNVPAVAVKVAAVRSHMSASLPAYTPSGFSFDHVASQPQKVSITYKAGYGSGAYTLGEQKSSWDSKTLSDNNFANGQVQTSQVDGTTVYIYGPSDNASWVNNGILYTINNRAGLNSDQLLQIVQSL